MLPDYTDIKKRIKEEPKWFDAHGVPRYDKFSPDLSSSIYSTEVVLLEICCQYCLKKFLVEVRWYCTMFLASEPRPSISEDFEKWFKNKRLCPIHYGDPPNHGCTGDTMNCYDLEVLEFWRRENFKWIRFKKYEVKLEDHKDYIEEYNNQQSRCIE